MVETMYMPALTMMHGVDSWSTFFDLSVHSFVKYTSEWILIA